MIIKCFVRWSAPEDFMSLEAADVLGGKVLGVDLDIIQEALRLAGETFIPGNGASGAKRVGNVRYFQLSWDTFLSYAEMTEYMELAKASKLADTLEKPYPGAFRGE